MDLETDPLGQYNPIDESKTLNSDVDMDDKEIEEYEKRLEKFEQQVKSQEIRVQSAKESGIFELEPNYPSFYPMVFYQIDLVEKDLQNFVSQSFRAWEVMVGVFSFNLLVCLLLLSAGDEVTSPGSKISLSIVYLGIVVPLSLDFLALSIYRTFKTQLNTLSVLKVVFGLGIATVFEGILTLGFDSSGSCGLITSLTLIFAGHFVLGVLGLILTLGFAILTFLHFRLLRGIWDHYRGTSQGEHIYDDVKHGVAVKVIDIIEKKK